jgi:hypothetical protein
VQYTDEFVFSKINLYFFYRFLTTIHWS